MSRRPSASSWVSPKAAALPAPSLARRRLGPTRPTRTLRLSRRRRSRPWASAILKKWPHESACAIKRRLGQIFNAANDAVGQALSKTSLAGLAKFGRNCNRHEHVQSKGATTMGRLTNKNILITGGNSGIGLAAAQEFEREGARVAICGLNEGTLRATKETLGDAWRRKSRRSRGRQQALRPRHDVRHDQAGVRAPGRHLRKCRLQRVSAVRRRDRAKLRQGDSRQFQRS